MELLNLDVVKKNYEKKLTEELEDFNLNKKDSLNKKNKYINFFSKLQTPFYFQIKYNDGSGSYYKIDLVEINPDSDFYYIKFKGESINNNLKRIKFIINSEYIVDNIYNIEYNRFTKEKSKKDYDSIKKIFLENLNSKLKDNYKLPNQINVLSFSEYEQSKIYKNPQKFIDDCKKNFNKCFLKFDDNYYCEDSEDFLKQQPISINFICGYTLDSFSEAIVLSYDSKRKNISEISLDSIYCDYDEEKDSFSYEQFLDILNKTLLDKK